MFKRILWATDFSEHARHAGRRLGLLMSSLGILALLSPASTLEQAIGIGSLCHT